MVYGSGAFAGGAAYSYGYVVGNRALTTAVNILYNVYLSDMETCYKLVPLDVARSLHLQARGFELEPEATAKLLRLGHRIYEVPITYRARPRAEGKKLTSMDGLKALGTLVTYRLWDPGSRA